MGNDACCLCDSWASSCTYFCFFCVEASHFHSRKYRWLSVYFIKAFFVKNCLRNIIHRIWYRCTFTLSLLLQYGSDVLFFFHLLMVWLCGKALVWTIEITLRRAWLVLRWVTVSIVQFPLRENLSQYITSHPGQLSLAIPPWVGAVSTSQRGGDALQLGRKGRYGSWVGGR